MLFDAGQPGVEDFFEPVQAVVEVVPQVADAGTDVADAGIDVRTKIADARIAVEETDHNNRERPKERRETGEQGNIFRFHFCLHCNPNGLHLGFESERLTFVHFCAWLSTLGRPRPAHPKEPCPVTH